MPHIRETTLVAAWYVCLEGAHLRRQTPCMDEQQPVTTDVAVAPRRSRRDELFNQLFGAYGPLLTRDQLVQVLGFRTAHALERSADRGHLGLKVFRIPHRTGVFALVSDLADYFDSLGQQVANKNERDSE